jgi:hypothetical protein
MIYTSTGFRDLFIFVARLTMVSIVSCLLTLTGLWLQTQSQLEIFNREYGDSETGILGELAFGDF